MRKKYLSVLTGCLVLVFIFGCKQSQKEVIVDEPSVKLEAELNLHYKTFSEVELTEKYMERWLYKYNYLPGAKVMSDEELFSAINL